MSLGYVSFGTLWSAQPISGERLKLATLLFDQLVFNDPGKENAFAASILDAYAHGDAVSEHTIQDLDSCWSPAPAKVPRFSIYGPNDQWPWEHAPESLRNATRRALNDLGAEDVSEGGDHYDLYKFGGYTMS